MSPGCVKRYLQVIVVLGGYAPSSNVLPVFIEAAERLGPPWKAPRPIDVTELPRATEVRLVLLETLAPIVVTDVELAEPFSELIAAQTALHGWRGQ